MWSSTFDYDSSYRYLGLTFNECMDYKYTVQNITNSASRALSAVYTKFLSSGGFSFEVFEKLYRVLVEPVLYYTEQEYGEHQNGHK